MINSLYFSSFQDLNKTFVIVSIFGKSSLIAKSCKSQFVNNIYDRSIFNSSMVKNSNDASNQVKIERSFFIISAIF